MKIKKYKRYTRTQLLLGTLSLIIVGSGVTLVVLHFVLSNQFTAIPKDVQQQVAFSMYAPADKNQGWTVSKPSVNYNSQSGILALTVTSKSNSFALSEQATPQVFSNVPQYYPALLSKLNSYGQVQTGLGTVNLTRPTELHNGQTAVLNNGGTLLFVRPQHNLSNTQWASFFSALKVVR